MPRGPSAWMGRGRRCRLPRSVGSRRGLTGIGVTRVTGSRFVGCPRAIRNEHRQHSLRRLRTRVGSHSFVARLLTRSEEGNAPLDFTAVVPMPGIIKGLRDRPMRSSASMRSAGKVGSFTRERFRPGRQARLAPSNRERPRGVHVDPQRCANAGGPSQLDHRK